MGKARDRVGTSSLGREERILTAFFGVRGVGSLFYLAYATGQADFAETQLLWSTVAFTVALSVIVHGVTATPWMKRLERVRRAAT